MILKCKEISDLYKRVIQQDQFASLSLTTFKNMVPFFIYEKQNKWASQCYCHKCGNSVAAVRYLKQLGARSDDDILTSLDESDWYKHIICVDSGSMIDQIICLRNKKSVKKCFKHKRKNQNCNGKFKVLCIFVYFYQ